jgi:hypothetical protein
LVTLRYKAPPITILTNVVIGGWLVVYLHRLSSVGGHKGIGPPSKAGTWGTAAITYVPTNPIIRSEALIARFMDFLLNRDRLPN